jgi:tetratricopeptide (TPR) repeat protein
MYGRFEEALATISAVEEMRRNLETRADLRAVLLERRADGLLQMGRYADVERLLGQAESIRGPTGQEGSAQFNTIAMLRSRLMMFRGNIEAARQALKLFAYKSGTQGSAVSREYLDLLVALGEIDLAEGNANEALSVGNKALALIEASPVRQFEKLWEARSSIITGRAYLMQHRATEAIPLLTRGADLSRQLYDIATSPDLAAADVALASAMLDVAERAKAEELAKEAAAILRTHKELGAQFTDPVRLLEARLH